MTVGMEYLDNLKRAKNALDQLISDSDVPQRIAYESKILWETLDAEIIRHSLQLCVEVNKQQLRRQTEAYAVSILDHVMQVNMPLCDECDHPHSNHVDGGACSDPKCWCGEYRPKPNQQPDEHSCPICGGTLDYENNCISGHPDPLKETLHTRPDE